MSADSKMESLPGGRRRTDDPGGLRIQFLYFAACPNSPQALALLHETLLAEGLAPEIDMIAVETDDAAQRHNFYGSPTIRINDEDVAPPDAAAQPSLACRLYPQPDGRFAPYPSAESIIHALRKASHRA